MLLDGARLLVTGVLDETAFDVARLAAEQGATVVLAGPDSPALTPFPSSIASKLFQRKKCIGGTERRRWPCLS